ncbi:hypothetical protein MO973_36770 [Paenibacillus sp. TRM 82003]|uniref:DUF4190 domain-containing protein n=1 Tax=Kineococcus sp. TRM81007 TaxID=2925831 RepID=UPI001F5A3921|nr:DUF4190 domain-containing protein [Kineococcus sp. TRM81007]MCI2239929.1 hypothetical protein [Kineococcus sp. TRM81007]MCI3925766.1 hypothetical protein [Paenibacillus sp. TRM 82003]
MGEPDRDEQQRSWWVEPDDAARPTGDAQEPRPGQPDQRDHASGYDQSYPQSYGQSYPQGYGQSYGQGYDQSYPPGYGQGHDQSHGQGYPQGYGEPPVTGTAHAVLWTAVGGLVLLGTGLGWIASIVSLALTPAARREIVASQGARRGLGFLLAGKIISWVTIALTVLFVVGVAVFVAWAAQQGTQYGYDGHEYDFGSVARQVRV